jgi:GLPGLI family protein
MPKAELDFEGDIAWFAEKIPFNDGPYKFKGLPGLILEIEDSKENHIFLLQKIEKRISQNNIYESENLNKKRKLSLTEFSIFYKEFRKDPIKNSDSVL